jgi:GNAT superfamily N-acetyltransferase
MELVPASSLSRDSLAALEKLYEDRFPGELRAPLDDLLRDEVAVLISADGQPGGFAVTRALGPTGWVFLRYFAVAARGQGVGSQMWAALRQRWAHAGYSHVMLDVEDPAEPGPEPDEVSIRDRRIAFYQRLGVELLPVREYLPPHDDVPHRLLLLTAATGVAALPDVRAVVEGVYEYRYGLAPDDPAVRHTLRASGLID